MFNSFKKYGGINVSATNNIVKNNYTTSNNLLIPYQIGLLNSKVNSQSHLDMSNNSILNVNTIYFSNGTSISGSDPMTRMRASINFYVSNSAGTLVIDTARSFGVTSVTYVPALNAVPGYYAITLTTQIPTQFYISGTAQTASNPYAYTSSTVLTSYSPTSSCVVSLIGISGNVCKVFISSIGGATRLNQNGFASIQMFF